MPIQFISLISRQDKPLYIQSFAGGKSSDEEDPIKLEEQTNKFLKFNFLSHMAVDILTSPTSLNLRQQQQQYHESQGSAPHEQPIYLLLFIQDNISVYGYETSNGVKIVIGLNNSNTLTLLNELFLAIHKSYIRTICNPFNNVNFNQWQDESVQDNILQSSTFDTNMKKIVTEWTIKQQND